MNYKIAKDTGLKPYKSTSPHSFHRIARSVFKLQALFIGRGAKHEAFRIFAVVSHTMNVSRSSAGKAHCSLCRESQVPSGTGPCVHGNTAQVGTGSGVTAAWWGEHWPQHEAVLGSNCSLSFPVPKESWSRSKETRIHGRP